MTDPADCAAVRPPGGQTEACLPVVEVAAIAQRVDATWSMDQDHWAEACAELVIDDMPALLASHTALTARLAAVEQERAAARAGVMELLEYTRHRVPCPQFNNVSMLGCTCGLWAVFERALSKEPPDGR